MVSCVSPRTFLLSISGGFVFLSPTCHSIFLGFLVFLSPTHRFVACICGDSCVSCVSVVLMASSYLCVSVVSCVFLHAPFCCLFLGGCVSQPQPVILYFWGFLCFSAPPTFLLFAFVGILAFLVFLSGVDD